MDDKKTRTEHLSTTDRPNSERQGNLDAIFSKLKKLTRSLGDAVSESDGSLYQNGIEICEEIGNTCKEIGIIKNDTLLKIILDLKIMAVVNSMAALRSSVEQTKVLSLIQKLFPLYATKPKYMTQDCYDNFSFASSQVRKMLLDLLADDSSRESYLYDFLKHGSCNCTTNHIKNEVRNFINSLDGAMDLKLLDGQTPEKLSRVEDGSCSNQELKETHLVHTNCKDYKEEITSSVTEGIPAIKPIIRKKQTARKSAKSKVNYVSLQQDPSSSVISTPVHKMKSTYKAPPENKHGKQPGTPHGYRSILDWATRKDGKDMEEQCREDETPIMDKRQKFGSNCDSSPSQLTRKIYFTGFI